MKNQKITVVIMLIAVFFYLLHAMVRKMIIRKTQMNQHLRKYQRKKKQQ